MSILGTILYNVPFLCRLTHRNVARSAGDLLFGEEEAEVYAHIWQQAVSGESSEGSVMSQEPIRLVDAGWGQELTAAIRCGSQ